MGMKAQDMLVYDLFGKKKATSMLIIKEKKNHDE
jgi:hypothetical protein